MYPVCVFFLRIHGFYSVKIETNPILYWRNDILRKCGSRTNALESKLKPPTLNWWPPEFWSINHQPFNEKILRPSLSCCFSLVAGCVWLLHVNQWPWSVNHCYPDTVVVWWILGSKNCRDSTIPGRNGVGVLWFCGRSWVFGQTRLQVKFFFETNSKKGPLKMDGWKMTISFWGLVLLASGSCNPLKGDFKPF